MRRAGNIVLGEAGTLVPTEQIEIVPARFGRSTPDAAMRVAPAITIDLPSAPHGAVVAGTRIHDAQWSQVA